MRTKIPSKREKSNWSKIGVQDTQGECKMGSREIPSMIGD